MKTPRFWAALIFGALLLLCAPLVSMMLSTFREADAFIPGSGPTYLIGAGLYVLALAVGATGMLLRVARSAGLAPALRSPAPFIQAPAQHAGFTAMELEVVNAVCEARPDCAAVSRDQLSGAWVGSRVNTGHGSLTKLELGEAKRSLPLPDDIRQVSPLFVASDLGVIRAVLWARDGGLIGLELTAKFGSADVDWAAVDFELVDRRTLIERVELRREPDDPPAEQIVDELTPKLPLAPPLAWS